MIGWIQTDGTEKTKSKDKNKKLKTMHESSHLKIFENFISTSLYYLIIHYMHILTACGNWNSELMKKNSIWLF